MDWFYPAGGRQSGMERSGIFTLSQTNKGNLFTLSWRVKMG